MIKRRVHAINTVHRFDSEKGRYIGVHEVLERELNKRLGTGERVTAVQRDPEKTSVWFVFTDDVGLGPRQ
jgi:hypothetical protein